MSSPKIPNWFNGLLRRGKLRGAFPSNLKLGHWKLEWRSYVTSGYSKHRTPRAWFPTSRISRLVLLTLGTGLIKWTSPRRFCEGRPSPTSEGLGSPRGIRGGVGAGCGAGRCGTEVVVLLARVTSTQWKGKCKLLWSGGHIQELSLWGSGLRCSSICARVILGCPVQNR